MPFQTQPRFCDGLPDFLFNQVVIENNTLIDGQWNELFRGFVVCVVGRRGLTGPLALTCQAGIPQSLQALAW